MRAFGAHESSIRHATSLSEQTERRLPSAWRNCRLRGGTAECAEELGKLQLEARRLLSVSVPGVRLRRRQVLGPRRKRQRRTVCRVRPAADLAAAAEQAAAAAHKTEKATAQQLEVAAKEAAAARQEANPTREPRVAHSGHPHSPWPCSLPTAPPQLACPSRSLPVGWHTCAASLLAR